MAAQAKGLTPLTPAQQELVNQNASLIFYVARRYRHIPGEDWKELLGQLHLRLCLAVQNWDPTRGHRISSYLVKSLDGEVKNYFRDHIWLIRPPRRLREKSMSEVLDTVGGSASLAREAGEDPAVIRSCVLPQSLETLVDSRDQDDDLMFLAADIDVEEEVVEKLGGGHLLRDVFGALTLEERIILALVMSETKTPDPGVKRRIKSVSHEIQLRFMVGRTTADAAATEVQEKAQRLYARFYAGEPLPQSTGCRALRRALLPRFTPPSVGYVRRREGLVLA